MKNLKILISLFTTAVFYQTAVAQVNPLKSQFFDNAFLFNPAKAGADSSGVISANFSSQWNRMPGAPNIYSLTASAPIGEKMGLGLLVSNDKAGLIGRASVVGAYSYLVPFSSDISLRFGLSAGYVSENLSVDQMISANKSTDPSYINFSDNHQNIIKAGFGVTFSIKNLEAQASLYNLHRKLNGNLGTTPADRPGITATAAYGFGNKDDISYKAIVGLRQIQGLSDYLDFGMRATYLNKLDLSALYHTNKSFTAGVGYNHDQKFKASFMYNTETPEIRGLTSGTFEIALYVPFSLIKR